MMIWYFQNVNINLALNDVNDWDVWPKSWKDPDLLERYLIQVKSLELYFCCVSFYLCKCRLQKGREKKRLVGGKTRSITCNLSFKNWLYFFKIYYFLPTRPRIIMRKTVRRRPRTTVKVNFSWSGSLVDVWYLANKSSPNLIRTGTEVSLGGEPESLATATKCVSVVLRWSRSSRVKSPWSLTLKI